MNYLTEARRNALAAEYVIGTLHGRARIRFQSLLIQHLPMRQSLWYWERHLNEMGGSLPEQMPDPRVWQNIQTQLGFNKSASPTSGNVISMPIKPSNHRWQWLAGLSSVAALLLAVLLILPLTEPSFTAPDQVAVVQSEKAQALWLIELRENNIDVQALGSLDAQADKDYELWMVPADGRPPISLGLLPKQGEKTLPRLALLDQVQIAALAVSLEPLGGSPTGQPTTVLYTTELVTL